MKRDYIKAKIETLNQANSLGLQHHMSYSPTSDRYWDSDLKILCVNLEPYGYEEYHRYHVSKDDLIGWMLHAGQGRRKSRTVRNTVAAASVLKRSFKARRVIPRSAFPSAYRNLEALHAALDEICYYNVRPISNQVKSEADRGPSDYTGPIAKCISAEILALNADCMIVSGAKAKLAIQKPLNISPDSNDCGVGQCEQAVIMSVKHFSRPSYDQLTTVLNRGLKKLIHNKTIIADFGADDL